MCGTSRNTISSSVILWSFEPNRYFRIGIELSPGMPVQLWMSCWFWMPPRMLASPSRSRIVCSLFFCAMIGSVTPSMVTLLALRTHFDLHLQRDVVVVVHGRRHLDVHADVDVLELRFSQRRDGRGHAHARLERAGRDRNARADLHRCLLPVGGADARILQNLGIRIGKAARWRWPCRS